MTNIYSMSRASTLGEALGAPRMPLRSTMRACLFAIVTASAVLVARPAPAAVNSTTIKVGVHRNMRAFLVTPSDPGPHPALLVLHTSGGLEGADTGFAERLAQAGYVALVPAFMEAYGLTARMRREAFTTDAEPIYTDLIAALDTLRHTAGVDGTRLGAVGFSNGGYFAAWLAATGKIGAAVAYYGAFSGAGSDRDQGRFRASFTKNSAPLLILHGADDQTVPAGAAQHLASILAAAGSPYEMHLYPGAGHRFERSPRSDADNAAAGDAWQRSLAFLKEHLKQP